MLYHNAESVNFELIKMEKTPLAFVWYYIKKIKVYFFGAFLFFFVSLIINRFGLYYYSQVMDLANAPLESAYWQKISFFILLAGVLALAESLIKRIPLFFASKYVPIANTWMMRDAFDYVNKHSIAFFNREMSGNISMKVQQLSSGLSGMFYMISDAIIHPLCNLATALLFLGFINKYFLLAILLWIIIVVFIGHWWAKKMVELSRRSGSAESKAAGVITDSFSNYSEIKSFANYKFERVHLFRYLSRARHSITAELRGQSVRQLMISLLMDISILLFGLITFAVFYRGLINPLEFIFALTLFGSISTIISQIVYGFSGFFRNYGKLKSALDTLAVDPEIIDKPGAPDLKPGKAGVSFKNVAFAYDEGHRVFENLSLEIAPGEKVGLVGASGSGKSTFVKLVLRYFDVQSGAVLINGQNVREVTQDSLHRNIAVIPQDISLFNRSLFDNIKYGNTHAKDKEVFAAARKACADDFIRAFPNGYETIVGERGIILSGGERQRIAIARAMLKNAPLLIFDEATSALDSRSERHIQKSLTALMKNKTVIAIAHRLSTLREMDRILVFDKGKIVEQGSHLSLLRRKGLYYKYYNLQADGFFGAANPGTPPDTVL